MPRKVKNVKQNDGERSPSGIPEEDWKITPISVRKYIAALLDTKKPRNHLPWGIVALLNILIAAGLAYSLENNFVFLCVTPHYISSISASLILVGTSHLLWHYIYPAMRRSPLRGNTVTITLGQLKFEVDRNFVFAILNELHPWKISGRVIGIALLVLALVGTFLNTSIYSPFYAGGEPFIIQGFAVQRFNSPIPEQLAPDAMLTMTNEEKVILEAVILGETQISCTWFIAASNPNVKTGCSISYHALASGERDSLSVFVKPACGSRQESASLNIAVQP